ncbi:MAG: PAS domain S-box protein [Pseudomonadota bacterium]|nr:PAS domain S-box protein [Pseudomonadota bacterium]
MPALDPDAGELLSNGVPLPRCLQGGGETGALLRAFDWHGSPLGAAHGWPEAFRVAIGLLLNARQPMVLWWGHDSRCFYNDAYRRMLGPERPPGLLGRPGREVWAEVWPLVVAHIVRGMSGSGGTFQEAPLADSRGRAEAVHWTYTYSPVLDSSAAGGIGGVLATCSETTTHRRQLAESEARFRDIADSTPVLIWIADVNKTCVWFNTPWLAFTGRTMAQEIGYGWVDGVHPEDFDRCVAAYDAAFDRREPYHTQYRRKRWDGEWRILDASGTPRFVDGQFVGYIGSCLDVTEQTLAARALSDSEEQLRLATEAAEVGLWDLDTVTDSLYWPPRVKAMFGISADMPVSMADFYGGIHPQDRGRTVAAFEAAIDPGRRALYDVDYRTVGKEDGLVRWVAAKGRALFRDDRCVRVIGTAIDISTRKAAEAELRELNETLEDRVAEALAERKVFVDIVEATDAFVLVIDRGHRFLAINRASTAEFKRVFGVRPRVGDNLLELLQHRPKNRDVLKALWGRALAGEEFTTVEEFNEPNSDRRHYEMKFNPLRDRNGELIGAFQFVYDVTERLRDQARIAEVERQLRQSQKIDAIGQLTGGVAHDFNNLLMVITGGLSLLKRPGEPQRHERILTQMTQAAERGASLSRQLLAFARRQPLNPEPVDVHRQIDGMRELLDRTLRGDVQVRTELAEDLWPVKVDPAELELVLLNLCVNARDAMPQGGVITVGGRNARAQREQHLDGDFVILTVADTGIGMSAQILARIFEPFFTTKEIGKGSGLGLPQVYGFAQQSGGSVKVDSVVGRGTTVTLMLPRSDIAPQRPAAKSDPDTTLRRQASKGVVLLVEDDDEVAVLVTEMVGQLGYRVIRVASAGAALGALADHREVCVVFSDVMMPGPMNGLALAAEVRRRYPQLPVLLTTGYAGSDTQAVDVEDVDVLLKPYEIDALDAALRAALDRSKRRLADSPPVAAVPVNLGGRPAEP